MLTQQDMLDNFVENVEKNNTQSKVFLQKASGKYPNLPIMRQFKQFVFLDTSSNTSLGINKLVHALNKAGFRQRTYTTKKLPDYKSFIVITRKDFKKVSNNDTGGEETIMESSASKLLKQFNDREKNLDGKLTSLIIGDSALKEGVNLQAVKFVHILGIVKNHSDLVQSTARAIRNCSRAGTPYDEVSPNKWNICIKIYTPKIEGTDLYPYEILKLLQPLMTDKENLEISVKNLMRTTAFDKLLLEKINKKSEEADKKLKIYPRA